LGLFPDAEAQGALVELLKPFESNKMPVAAFINDQGRRKDSTFFGRKTYFITDKSR
jgi:hypothetical protein